jgi:hypothetical protein
LPGFAWLIRGVVATIGWQISLFALGISLIGRERAADLKLFVLVK